LAGEESYFTNVVVTALTVVTFFIIILAFLYMIWGKEEKQKEAKS
jgi:preprotein translocase subunit SecG